MRDKKEFSKKEVNQILMDIITHIFESGSLVEIIDYIEEVGKKINSDN